jgi:peroxiredoxin
MMLKGAIRLLMLTVLAVLLQSSKPARQEHVIGKTVPDFRLKNIDGRLFGLSDLPGAKGFILVFSCNHCPFAKLYTARLNALNAHYRPLGVPLLAINPMDSALYEAEGAADMRAHALAEAYSFPYLQDVAQSVSRLFAASHTPAAYVLWKEGNSWVIRYSGAIDDNGEVPEKAEPFIAKAVDALLQGKPVAKPETLSFGCAISYRQISR